MLYNCPICGEIEATDIKFTCQKCGSEEVEERGDEFYICPKCGQINDDGVKYTCRICDSDDVTR